MIYAGVDDGNSVVNISLSTGESVSIPSRAKAGEENQAAVISAARSVYRYQTSDGIYSVGNVKKNDSTQFDAYPTSALNRALVAHALACTSLPDGSEIMIASGLPLGWYYKKGKVNKELVSRKISNLLKNDVTSLDTPVVLPKIVDHMVTSEAIASWLDVVLVRAGDGSLEMSRDRAGGSYAIIDLGGRTTDIAVIEGGNIDFDRSTTEDIGILTVKDKIAEQIGVEFGHTPNEMQVEEALSTRRIKLFGQVHGIDDIVNNELKSITQRIESLAKKTIRSSGDIDEVIFVGGSMKHYHGFVSGWFKNQSIAHDPGFANSRGMCKYIEYYHQKTAK